MNLELPPPGTRFRVVLADPAWPFDDPLSMGKGKKGHVKRGAAEHYSTMTVEQIAALPVRHLLDEAAIGVVWVPNPLLAEGLFVLQSWGFTYKQIWPWVKTTQDEDRISDAAVAKDGIPEDLAMAFLMGRIARYCSEVALVGTRGPIYQHLRNRSVRNVILAPKLPHSQKPEKAHDHLDVMFPEGARMELFARRQRRKKPRGGAPWACIGNEAPATKGRDIGEVLHALIGRPLGAQMDLLSSSALETP